jgi:hypothetical protein
MSSNDNGRPTVREFPTMAESFDALALDGAMLFLLRRMRGEGWRLTIREARPCGLTSSAGSPG